MQRLILYKSYIPLDLDRTYIVPSNLPQSLFASLHLYRFFKYKNTSYKYSRGPIITGSKYLYRPSGASIDYLCLKGR